MQRRQRRATDEESSPDDASVAETPAETPVDETPVKTSAKAPDKEVKAKAKEEQATDEATAAPIRTFYVRVKPGLKWQSIRSAGLVFTDQPVAISEGDPALKELTANPYLQVSEDPTWPEP